MIGWLSPQGDYFVCTSYGHRHLAGQLCRKLYKISSLNPDYELEQKGWLRLVEGNNEDGSDAHIFYNKHITAIQYNWLAEKYDSLFKGQQKDIDEILKSID